MIVDGDWLNSWAYACAYFAPVPTCEISITLVINNKHNRNHKKKENVSFSYDYAWQCAYLLSSQVGTKLTVRLFEPGPPERELTNQIVT